MITYTEELLYHCYCNDCDFNFTITDDVSITHCPSCGVSRRLIEKCCTTCQHSKFTRDNPHCFNCNDFLSNWKFDNDE